MNKLYTAVGKFRCRGRGDYRTPYIMLGKKEYLLDLQEMLLWSTLNWRILSMEEAFQLYNVKVLEVGCSFSRSPEDCLRRLVQRGLVAEGIGESGADALYELLAELYIVPLSTRLTLRLAAFARLILLDRLPFKAAKNVFRRDKRDDKEKKVIHLTDQMLLSTAEVIKCFEKGVDYICVEEKLLDALYGDEYTTSDNLVHSVRFSPACNSTIISIANLYLRQQIIFDRI